MPWKQFFHLFSSLLNLGLRNRNKLIVSPKAKHKRTGGRIPCWTTHRPSLRKQRQPLRTSKNTVICFSLVSSTNRKIITWPTSFPSLVTSLWAKYLKDRSFHNWPLDQGVWWNLAKGPVIRAHAATPWWPLPSENYKSRFGWQEHSAYIQLR